ncbi:MULTISPECIES: hypothetical protein [Actinomadura]|uniref:DUF4175 domain-containing protein n=1 Tax=Actinomadura yumaensis TaxID=111807 RepID=A0ABW2CCQ9_9ACTN|nr:hypothetical protein [Actinomadura sp. J1-007]MWK38225.1 hypothetical protein [Actinomadura sp. J1-007]
MPIPKRTHPPVRPRENRAVQATPMSRALPVLIAAVVLIAYTVFWMTTTALLALAFAFAAAVAGTVLLTLVFGAGWLRPARGASRFRRNR